MIPHHGRCDFLEATLASVLDQVEPIGEIMVITDVASPMAERLVAETSRRSDVPIRYVDRSAEQNPGVSASRNHGVRVTELPWVALLDDDDLWDPEFSAVVCDALSRSGDHIALVAKVLFGRPDTDGVIDPVIPGLTADEMMQIDNFAHGGNVVARTSLLRDHPYDTALHGGEDWDLFVRLLTSGIRYTAVEQPLMKWRDHGVDRASQRGLTSASMLEYVVDKHSGVVHRATLRHWRFKSAWLHQQLLPDRVGRWRARARLVWNAPYRRLVADTSFRRRKLAAVARLTRRRSPLG